METTQHEQGAEKKMLHMEEMQQLSSGGGQKQILERIRSQAPNTAPTPPTPSTCPPSPPPPSPPGRPSVVPSAASASPSSSSQPSPPSSTRSVSAIRRPSAVAATASTRRRSATRRSTTRWGGATRRRRTSLVEIVAYLKDPAKFTRLGAKLPEGRSAHGAAGDGEDAVGQGHRGGGGG